MSVRHFFSALLLGGVLSILAGVSFPVSAEESLPMRKVGVSTTKNFVLVSFSYRDAFPPSVRKKLTSGLKTSVLIQLTLERKGKKTPVAYWARTVEVTYDLWEERFFVIQEDDAGRRRAKVGSKSDAVDLAGILDSAAIGPIPEMDTGTYRVHVKIETNPVSKEMVETIRSWLARSRAKKSGSIQTSNYFGSFVGALVDRRISQAEHTVEFVSQWFETGNR